MEKNNKALAEIQQRMKEKKYRVVCYMRVEADDIELMTYKEAANEIRQLRLMQPENIYAIEDIDATK